MSGFLRMVDLTGNDLVSAGIGLETIGNLLGADGVEHHLSTADEKGLYHALMALGGLVKATGYDLCTAVKDEVADARESQEVRHA